jgi:hypothetical protein
LPGGLPAAKNRANGAARVPKDHGRPLGARACPPGTRGSTLSLGAAAGQRRRAFSAWRGLDAPDRRPARERLAGGSRAGGERLLTGWDISAAGLAQPQPLVASSPLSPVVARPEMSTGSSTKYLAKFVVAAGRRSCHTGTGVDQLVASRRRSSSMPSDPIGVWLFTTCERQAFPPTTNITPLAACAQDPQAATAAPSRTTAASPPRRDLPLAMIQPRRLSCRAHVPVAWTHPLCLSQAA